MFGGDEAATDAAEHEAARLRCGDDEGCELAVTGEAGLGIDAEATSARRSCARRPDESRGGDQRRAREHEDHDSADPVGHWTRQRPGGRGGPGVARVREVAAEAQERVGSVVDARVEPVAGTEDAGSELRAAPDRGAEREERTEQRERDVRREGNGGRSWRERRLRHRLLADIRSRAGRARSR